MFKFFKKKPELTVAYRLELLERELRQIRTHMHEDFFPNINALREVIERLESYSKNAELIQKQEELLTAAAIRNELLEMMRKDRGTNAK